jgi:hypothetical protein
LTATYSGDPSTSVTDEIRFYLQDTNMDDPLMQNEEILFYNDKLTPVYGNTIATASYLADLIANRFGREVSISADGVSVGADGLQTKYRDIAKSLREQWHAIAGAGGTPDVGGILWGQELDPTLKPLVFGQGVNDNFRAGQQDYGGVYEPQNWPGYREGYWGYGY